MHTKPFLASGDTMKQKPKVITEKDLLETEYTKPITLMTYTEAQQILDKVRVRKYDLVFDKAKAIPKLEILFAFQHKDYHDINSGISLNHKVEAEDNKPIQNIADRPVVATDEEYEGMIDKDVHITMRSGHVLTGILLSATKYNLVLSIADKKVLVYKHAILQYEINR